MTLTFSLCLNWGASVLKSGHGADSMLDVGALNQQKRLCRCRVLLKGEQGLLHGELLMAAGILNP